MSLDTEAAFAMRSSARKRFAPALAREFGLGDQAAYDEAPRNTRAQSRDLHGAIAKAASHAGRS